MSKFDLWNMVENAYCDLEQLQSLMKLYSETYLDAPKDEFVKRAERSYVDMSNLGTLMLSVLRSVQEELMKAIDIAYAEMRREKEHAV